MRAVAQQNGVRGRITNGGCVDVWVANLRCGMGRGTPQPIGQENFLMAADAPDAVDGVSALPPQPWRLGRVGGQ